jgi:hypothetical protein
LLDDSLFAGAAAGVDSDFESDLLLLLLSDDDDSDFAPSDFVLLPAGDDEVFA